MFDTDASWYLSTSLASHAAADEIGRQRRFAYGQCIAMLYHMFFLQTHSMLGIEAWDYKHMIYTVPGVLYYYMSWLNLPDVITCYGTTGAAEMMFNQPKDWATKGLLSHCWISFLTAGAESGVHWWDQAYQAKSCWLYICQLLVYIRECWWPMYCCSVCACVCFQVL